MTRPVRWRCRRAATQGSWWPRPRDPHIHDVIATNGRVIDRAAALAVAALPEAAHPGLPPGPAGPTRDHHAMGNRRTRMSSSENTTTAPLVSASRTWSRFAANSRP